MITLLEEEVDRPIEASLFRELDRDEVENTDLIRPLMFYFFSLEDCAPKESSFLSRKLFWMPSNSSSMLQSISLLKVLIEAFLADYLT